MGYRNSDPDPLGPFAGGDAPDLDLDLSAPDLADRRRGAASARAPVAGRPAVGAVHRDAGHGHPGHGPPARGGAALRQAPEPAPEPPPRRALELAHHGAPPSPWLEIPYAFGVLRRNRALRQKIPSLRRVRDAAEADLDAAMHALGVALHAERDHPRRKELGSALRVADATSNLTAEHRAELERTRADTREKLARIEQSMERSELATRPLRARARELRAQIVVYQTDFEAASTAAHGASQELDRMAKSGPDDANRRIELEAGRTLRRGEADAARVQIEARTPELTELEAKLSMQDAAAAKAEKVMEDARSSLARTEELLAMNAADAKEAYAKALVALAEEAVRLGLDQLIAAVAARRAKVCDETYDAHARELEMHELALRLHYPKVVRRGLVVFGVLCATVLCAAVLAVVR